MLNVYEEAVNRTRDLTKMTTTEKTLIKELFDSMGAEKAVDAFRKLGVE